MISHIGTPQTRYFVTDHSSQTNRALKASAAGDKGLTYAEAGVSVDAGNALVEAIKPYVRATRRTGADAEIGGFGGIFDIKAIGYTDPILVSGTDGVGTKLRVAVDVGIHDLVGPSHSNLKYICTQYLLCIRNRSRRDVCQRSFGSRGRTALLPRLLRMQQT